MHKAIYWANAFLWTKLGILLSFLPDVARSCVDIVRQTASSSQIMGVVAVTWGTIIAMLLLYCVALGNKRLWVDRETEIINRYSENG